MPTRAGRGDAAKSCNDCYAIAAVARDVWSKRRLQYDGNNLASCHAGRLLRSICCERRHELPISLLACYQGPAERKANALSVRHRCASWRNRGRGDLPAMVARAPMDPGDTCADGHDDLGEGKKHLGCGIVRFLFCHIAITLWDRFVLIPSLILGPFSLMFHNAIGIPGLL